MKDLWDNIYSSLKERIAYIYLLVLLFMCLCLKLYLVCFHKPRDLRDTNSDAKVAFVKIEEVLKAKKAKRDSLYQNEKKRRKKVKSNSNKKYSEKRHRGEEQTQIIFKEFQFDPNLISEDSLELLGFSKFAIANLRKYKAKGGKIKSAEKLKSIYGVEEKTYERIKDFIRIEPFESDESRRTKSDSTNTVNSVAEKKKKFKKRKWSPVYVNINTADTTEWKKLKGIGPYYSKMLVERRSRLGGYFSKEQIRECWFLPDSTYENISDYLIVDPLDIRKRNLNDMDQTALANHPYIGRKKARIIHNFRRKHALENIADLEKIRALNHDFIDTLKTYFIIQ